MNNARSLVTAIIFDWAGVFCSAGELFSHQKLTELTGLTVEKMSHATYALQQQYYRGAVSTNEFWQQVIRQFNLPLSIQELSVAYLASYRIYPEMFELASKVRTKIKTTLLSNLTSEMMGEILRTHYVDRYFDYVLFSNEIGHLKPEPESFATALNRLGTTAAETLVIDDSKNNVAAADALGFQTILFTSPKQCIQELTALVDFEV